MNLEQEPLTAPEEEQEQAQEQGYPVDLTEQEFLKFSMVVARKMGTLRSQTLIMGLYAVYLIITIVGIVTTFMESGQLSFALLGMMALTMAGAVLTFTLMPSRVKKAAKASYRLGNQNGYYGELSISHTAVMKNIGHETVTIPLTPQTLYIETKEFMSFTTAGQQRSIVLPARCMTPEMATAIREVVFSSKVNLNRRVFDRMEAAAVAPIARREFPGDPQTLYTVDFQFLPEEFSKLSMDVAFEQYTKQFFGYSMMAILLGLMLAMLQESIWWFPGVSLAMIVGHLAFTFIRAKVNAARGGEMEIRTHVTFTDLGVEIRVSPNGQRMSVMWQGLDRVVERRDFVEFYHGGGHLLRIPKRAIRDFEEFRQVVDSHFQPKKA